MADDVYYPYLNRGSYKWIPDDYGSTSAADFGVTQAYDIPVIDYGRQQNILPELFYNDPAETQIINGSSYVGKQAFEIVCRGLRKADGTVDKGGTSPNSNTQLYSADPGSVAPYYLSSPFLRIGVRRNNRTIAQDLYNPPVKDGFGFSSFDLTTNPFFFFSTHGMGTGKIASIELEYNLATGGDWYPEKGDTQLSGAENPPLALIAVLTQSGISSSMWWDTSRPQGDDIFYPPDGGDPITFPVYWGPPSNPVQQVTDTATLSALDAVRLTLGTDQLTGVFLPQYIHHDIDAANTTTFAEMGITNNDAYFDPQNPSQQGWKITSRRRVNVRLSGKYWTLSDYFPELIGFLICPSWRVMNVQQDPKTGLIVPRPDALYSQPFNNGKYGSWNAMITGLRVYDALQCNAVPQHLENKTIGGESIDVTVESQLPCQIFGYAWRLSQAVTVSAYTPMVQPSRGKVLSSNPGEGFGDRVSTFYFKIYHPDIVGLGVAHGVRFYYKLIVLADPGSNPFFAGAASLIGILLGIGTDTDMVMMQYAGPLAGQQTLTFQFLANQHGDPGKAIYSGQFGFAKQTVGVACLKQVSSGMSFIPSTFPIGPTNGIKALCYDEVGTDLDNYTFATLDAFGVTNFNQDNFTKTHIGGLTPFIKGSPKTNQSGIGAFDMAVNQSSTFQGPEKVSVFAKPKTNNITPGSSVPLSQICSDNNNHLATFISDERALGPKIRMYVGNWRLRLVAATDSSLKINTQLFFRFGFVPTDIDPSIINGTDLWNQAVEFHFEHQSRTGDTGMVFMAGPPPTTSQVIATPFLTETPIAYDTSWNVLYGDTSDSSITVINADDVFNKEILFDLSPWQPGINLVRLVVQVWAANVPVVTGAKYNPSVDLNYPAVELSWSGETEANFQTMIIEVRSGAILPQQDPYVMAYEVLSYNYLTTASCDISANSISAEQAAADAQSRAAANGETYVAPPFRDYELWGNFLDLNIPGDIANNKYTRLTPISSGVGGYNGLNSFGLLAHDTDLVINGGRLSVAVARNNVEVLDASKFQYGDMSVFTSDKTSTIVGGSVINPTTIFQVDTNYVTNNSLFNSWVYFELMAVGSDDLATYSLVRTNWFLIDTSGGEANSEFSGSITLQTSTVAETVITDPNSRLMLRIHVYAFKNRTISTNFISQIPENFHSGFTCIDFNGFTISFNGATFDITGGPMPGATRGNTDWYEGLPLTTSRTFGSADYYFVADASTVSSYILYPTTLMKTSFWYLDGWMFSPFWFIEMPQGACFEISDQAGLLQANPTSGTNFSSDETSQKAMRVRTAVGSQAVASVSASRQAELLGNESFLARQRIEVGGAASATNFLSVLQNPGANTPDRGMPEFIVRTGGTNIVSGKNPFIITGSPDVQRARRFYGANAQPRYLFYEEDQFDSDNQQASIIMLVNYDGTSLNWQNPYGNNFYGSTGKVVFNSDMKMVGIAADLTDYSLYFAGYRANNLANTSQGGMIVLKRLNQQLVFGTDSAAVGPLFFVDGQVTEDSWTTSMPISAQVFLPTEDTLNDTVKPPNRFNTLGSGGKPLAADESFPDLFVDPRGYIYVFYSLLTTNKEEAKNALGKVFCRESHNSGYWFGEPFPVADLGYNRSETVPNDTSFQAKHMVVLYNDHTKIYMLFFWAGGKIFMRLLPHPGATLSKFRVIKANKDPKTAAEYYHNSLSFLYMIEGDTAFTDREVTSGLEKWLTKQWTEGSEAPDTTPSFTEDTYDSYSVSGKSNNWGEKSSGSNVYAAIRILKYNNSTDIPQQRIGAFITSEGEVTLYFINAIGNLCYKRVRLYGNYPLITPTLIVNTSTI